MYTKESTIFKHLARNGFVECDVSLIGVSATVPRIVGDIVQVVKCITNPL